MNLDEIVSKRYSPYAFADKPVSEDTLYQILEAARWAPSSYNEQPWRFIYALKENEAAYQQLLSCAVADNQKWAKEAPVLLLSVAKRHFSQNGQPNRHAWHDTGMAMAFFVLKATEMGLYVHQMAGFSVEKAQEQLNIPEEFSPVAMVALGYRGDEERPDKGRKTVHELAMPGQWRT
jgi:nitroreductase